MKTHYENTAVGLESLIGTICRKIMGIHVSSYNFPSPNHRAGNYERKTPGKSLLCNIRLQQISGLLVIFVWE